MKYALSSFAWHFTERWELSTEILQRSAVNGQAMRNLTFYSLSAPRKWERPITGIARTHPLYRGASREKAAGPCTPVPTWKNQWFDTSYSFLQKIRKLSSLSPCRALKKKKSKQKNPNNQQPSNKNVKPGTRYSRLDKLSEMSWFNYNQRKAIVNFSNNCYHTVQANCFSFRLRGHYIHTMSQFTFSFFFFSFN